MDCYGVPAHEAGPIIAGLGPANLPGWWHQWQDAMEPWQQEVIGKESSAGLVRTGIRGCGWTSLTTRPP